MPRYTCPCCGYRTLERPAGSYDICEVCFWEVDFDDDPYHASGPNQVSLNEGRLTFVTHGATASHIARHVRPPRPEEIPRRPPLHPRIDPVRLRQMVADRRQVLEQIRDQYRRVRSRPPWSTNHRWALEETYPRLYEEWLILFDSHDPIQIRETLIGARSYEAATRLALTYDTQVRWLLPWLPTFTAFESLRHAIQAELGRWFRPDVVGPAMRFTNLALDAWASYERYRVGIRR